MSELSVRLLGGTGKLEVSIMTILTNLSRLAIISALSFFIFSSGTISDALARAAEWRADHVYEHCFSHDGATSWWVSISCL